MKKLLFALLVCATPVYAGETIRLEDVESITICHGADPDCMTEFQYKAHTAAKRQFDNKYIHGRNAERETLADLFDREVCTEEYWSWENLSFRVRAVECER